MRVTVRIFLRNERGAEIVELAIALPFLFLFVFALIDFTRLAVGYGTVRTAVVSGARRAAGPDRPNWTVFSELGLPANVVTPGALSTYPEFRNSQGDPGWYAAQAASLGVNTLHPLEVRAIAYANELLRRSLGGTQFPCDARAGCFRCFPVRNSSAHYTELFRDTAIDQWTSTMLTLECQYDSPTLIFGLLPGWGRRFVTVRARAYQAVENTDPANYRP